MILSWCFSLFVFVLVIILYVYLGIQYSKNKKQAGYEVFTFDYNELCIGTIKNVNCAFTNADFYGIVDWKNAPPNILCTVYITSNSFKNHKTSNYWITAADSKPFKTIGTLRWSILYYDTHSGQNNYKTTIPSAHSFISAASGVFENLANAEILMDFSTNRRKIHVFTDKKLYSKTKV